MQAALYSSLNNHAVRILQDGEIKGSGFLVVPKEGYTSYVLTAAHVFSESRNHISIQFLGTPDQRNNTRSIASDCIITHKSFDPAAFTDSVPYCDAALIKLPTERWMDQIDPAYWGLPEAGMPIQAVGFSAVNCDPVLSHASASHQTVIRAYTPSDHRISATIRGDFILNYADLDNDIQGMSGTVFAAQGQESIVMIGMIVTTTSQIAAHGQLNLVDMTGIRELLEAQGVLLEQKVISPITHVDENSFSYMIDQIKPKEHSENVFHYLNPNIGFWGRDAEINALEDFLEDDREIAFLGIVAPGGCGKSKLAYEFMQLHKDDPNWKMVYLGKGQITRLLTFSNYRYPRNLLLIVDYAGLHAKKLGEWLHHLSSIQHEYRPAKIRLLLLERDQAVNIELMTIPAAWMQKLYGIGEQRKSITSLRFSSSIFPKGGVLQPLCDEALLELMQHHAIQYGHPLPDEIPQKLLNHLKKKENNRISTARPLIALFITDAYIHGHPVTSWNSDHILEYFIERSKGHWDRLSQNNPELRSVIENCVTYATLVGSMHLDAVPAHLSDDFRYLERLGDESFISIISGINQSSDYVGTILPMEPDIVGEYFLLQRMRSMSLRKTKFRSMMVDAWNETENCFAVMARSIHDFGKHRAFFDFYLNNLDILMPPDKTDLEIEAHSRLLHLLLRCFAGPERHKRITEEIKILHERYPEHPVVIEDYAASLMLQWYVHLWDFKEQGKNVIALRCLHRDHLDSEYICTMYGKSLYNQILSCNHARMFIRSPFEEQHRIDSMHHYLDNLISLCKENPQNQRIQNSLQDAILFLNTISHL